MNTDWNIAQLNVTTALYGPDDERMHGFYSQLDAINALAEQSPGFVWRLKSESGNATDIQATDNPLLIVNMSVWDSIDALFDFAYRSDHRHVFANRRHWFEKPDGAYQVLWWVRAGHEPDIAEAFARLEALRASGPTAAAFNFKSRFDPPDA
ncbi:MAG: DUF3291 domain-containing protein [Pseudomonadota bacterium]